MGYASVPNCCIGWESSSLLVVIVQPVFRYYSSLFLCGSEADKAHVRKVAIMDFLAISFVSIVTAASNSVFMWKVDRGFVGDGLVVLVRAFDRLDR